MKLMVLNIAMIVICLLPKMAFSEIGILWTKQFDMGQGAGFFDVVENSDGGYIAVGDALFGSDTLNQWYLHKSDQSGNVVWDKLYGGSLVDRAYSVQRVEDSLFAVAGYTFSFGNGGADVWLLKVNEDGDTLWSHTYGDTLDNYAFCMKHMSDEGYIMAGDTKIANGNYDICLVKVDSIGNIKWSGEYGGDDYDDGYSVLETDDGNYFVVGDAAASNVLLVDSLGNLINEHHDDNAYYGATKSHTPGRYVVCGGKPAYYNDDLFYYLFLAEFTDSLHYRNPRTYGLPGNWSFGESIVATDDGGYLVVGSTGSFWSPHAYIIKVDENLDSLWSIEYQHAGSELYSVRATSDSGYIACGYQGNYALLMKLGERDTTDVVSGDSTNIPNNYLTLTSYPNPFNSETTIKFVIPAGSDNGIVGGDNVSKPQPVELSIYDLRGRKIAQLINDNLPAGEHSITWNANKLPSGIYFCRLSSNNKSITKKMVLLK